MVARGERLLRIMRYMLARTALLGAALLTTGLGFAVASAGRPEPSGSAEQRSAGSAPQKSAAVPMVVYKSPT